VRVTSSMYYENLYGTGSTKLTKQLFDVNKQIASGLSIQYAGDDVSTFSATMQLDNEMTTLGQIKKSTQSGYKISDQTDIVLNEFESSLERIQTLLIQAGNGTNDSTSLDAISAELRGIEKHLKTLANSSINGEYLFSGSAVDTKPIDENGDYRGNDIAIYSFLGSDTKQQYNLTGAELFLGEEPTVKKEITTNVVNRNLIQRYPQLQNSDDKHLDSTLTVNSTIRELMGDTDNIVNENDKKHFFYLRGVKHDGTAFKRKISMSDEEKIGELLTQIGNEYGNTINSKVVDVNINEVGEIVIKDLLKGSSKLDFHMVGAVDFENSNRADVDKIEDLDSGETNFQEVINPTNPPANKLYVKEFVKSPFDVTDNTVNNIKGLVYDRVKFAKDGSSITSNVSQILKSDNSYANISTKLSEVADLTQNNNNSLDQTTLILSGKNINSTSFEAKIELKDSGSSFTINGSKYTIYNVDEPREAVKADDFTYQQLADVMNMVLTNELPDTDSADDYDKAIYNSQFSANTTINKYGQLEFKELNKVTSTNAEISLYDENSGNFSSNATSALIFNSNNSLTVSDAKTNFFKTIDEIITAVENYNSFPDATNTDMRSVGIENAIRKIDLLQDHVYRAHSIVGANSNALSTSLERTQLLEVSTMTLRSSIVDTDLAEASLKLNQLTLNYQSMLATVGKVSKLSLVNYL